MSSHRFFSAALLALLALSGLVVGTGSAACLHEGAVQATCCRAPISAADVEGSCCAVDQTPSSESVQTGDACGCWYAPQAPADLAKATAPAAPKTAVAGMLPVAMTGALPPTVRTASPSARSVPPGGAHPLFILDCAYLI